MRPDTMPIQGAEPTSPLALAEQTGPGKPGPRRSGQSNDGPREGSCVDRAEEDPNFATNASARQFAGLDTLLALTPSCTVALLRGNHCPSTSGYMNPTSSACYLLISESRTRPDQPRCVGSRISA